MRCLKTKDASMGVILHPPCHSMVIHSTDSESNFMRQRYANASQGTIVFIPLSWDAISTV